MKLKNFLELYDNWNSIIIINDDSLNQIIKDRGLKIYEEHEELFDFNVVSFRFYNDELIIRIDYNKYIDCI